MVVSGAMGAAMRARRLAAPNLASAVLWLAVCGGGYATHGSGHRVEGLLETAGMALLSLGQRLEPFGDFLEALFAGGLGHARIHVGVFVSLAGDRRLQVLGGRADRLAGGRVADLGEEFQMAMGMAGLALGGRAEDRGDVVVALNVRLLGEVEVAAVRLALAGEGFLQVGMGLGILQCRHAGPPSSLTPGRSSGE